MNLLLSRGVVANHGVHMTVNKAWGQPGIVRINRDIGLVDVERGGIADSGDDTVNGNHAIAVNQWLLKFA